MGTARPREPVWRIVVWVLLAWVLLVLIVVGLASAQVVRSRVPVRAFRAANACPATGKIEVDTPCEKDGVRYVVDHKRPLCAGGADTQENMQYQEYQQSLVKDKIEIELCRVQARLREAETRCPRSP